MTRPAPTVDAMPEAIEKVVVSFVALVDVEVDLAAGTITASVGPPLDASAPESITLGGVTVIPNGLLNEQERSVLDDERVAAALELLAKHDWQQPLLARTSDALAAPLITDLSPSGT